MSPKFETFTRRFAKASKEPTLTVTVRGTLNINEPALIALGKPDAVVLLYDRDEAVIGVRPADREDPNAYRVAQLGSGSHSRTIVARDFCAWIGADLADARRYPLTMDGDIGCVSLRGPSRIVTGNRNRAGKTGKS